MKYSELRNVIRNPYFTLQEVRLRGGDIIPSQLTFWRKEGFIDQLKRGVYFFTDRASDICKEEIAFVLYEPSYISVELALKRYGLIPEMVYSITSVTTRTTRRFSNSLGSFIYHHITPRLFFGYSVQETRFGKYLFAEPEKALLDYLHLNQDTLDTFDAIKEIRINPEEFASRIDKKKLKDYARAFQSSKIDRLLDFLLSYVHT